MEDFITKYNTLIVIIGLIATLLGWLISYMNDIKGKLLLTAVIVSTCVLAFVLYASWTNNKSLFWLSLTIISNLIISFSYHYLFIRKKINKGLIKPKYESLKYKRFEDIKSLKYGFIEYSPFFWKERDTHKGIGIEVLETIFDNKIKLERYKYSYGEDSNWDNIFKDLEERKFDIIITPLFETRSRLYSHNIIYCSPIFYSNIGLYISNDSLNGLDQSKKSFIDAMTFVKKYIDERKWKPEILKGEIAEAIAKKYNLISKIQMPEFSKTKTAKDSDFNSILENMSSGSNEFGDFTFMEVFKAESIIKNNSNIKVTNILKNNELLYPVSFVLRKEDTVLRNLINIRLLELRENGDLRKVILGIANTINIDENSFDEIFIQKYNLDNLTIVK